jgi:trimeric autotransporter adhesin
MAQDFAAAFGVGSDDRSIGTLDSSGVALAAIQALYEEVQELRKRVVELEGKAR